MMYLKAINRQKKIVVFGLYNSIEELKEKVQKDCEIVVMTETQYKELKKAFEKNQIK